MKIKANFLFLILFLPVIAHCQTDTTKHTHYEYMTIISKHFDKKLTNICLSTSTGDYQEINYTIDKKSKEFDYKSVLELIEKYSTKGWEVTGTNFTHTGNKFSDTYFYAYYFLRRRK